MNVLVYTGPGTSPGAIHHTFLTLRSHLSSSYDVIPVTADTLSNEPWEETTALLVIPGGRDLPYVQNLSPATTHLIDNYVRNGGRYLGICAGAYFACRRVEFEKGRTSYEVIGDRELGFWPGSGVGSVGKGFVYGTEKGTEALKISIGNQLQGVEGMELDVYVNGGPWFDVVAGDQMKPNLDVLAWYQNLPWPGKAPEVPKPAIVECRIGNGVAVLTGPHVEYSAAAMNHSDPDLAPIIPVLTASEADRVKLVKSILGRLGLRVNDEQESAAVTQETLSPKLSELVLCGPGTDELIGRIRRESDNDGTVLNDTVNIIRISQGDGQASLKHVAVATDADAKPIIKVGFYPNNTLPPSSRTPRFDVSRYFNILNAVDVDSAWRCGSPLIYGEVMHSTQTFLEKNYKLSTMLPSGTVCVATHQLSGRGRGKNSWISQTGCLQFSFTLHHRDLSSAIFIQYLVALAIVEAVKSKPGCADLPVHIKWPNDIYVRTAEGKEGLRKIGGILVTSSFQNGVFNLVIGCGINLSNPRPTTSLAQLSPQEFTPEEMLARFMAQFKTLYDQFNAESGWKFEKFLDRYYRVWLHSNQEITIDPTARTAASQAPSTDTKPITARIVGIHSSGLLHAVTMSGVERLLQPDGNSFDMMRGLVLQKI
ncbi:biotin-protein ligase [Gaertneriomyces semiglobifer]|nr:biotin-protein ligase [Gaertneriomyces semiglobifer]